MIISTLGLNIKLRFLVSPSFPSVAILGAWFVEVAKFMLPLPPSPPSATFIFSPSDTKSAESFFPSVL
jgi:hypothetical protein